MARYQDLTREQAAGVEARILLRLTAVMEISQDARQAHVETYFQALMSLAMRLIEISIGNETFEDAQPVLATLKADLKDASFLTPRSRASAEAPLLIAIAAGAGGHVDYYAKPGLHERDRRNPELTMSVFMAADALSRIGMTPETFSDPAEADCALVLRTRDTGRATLDPAFFGRPLWPEGTPHAVRNMLVESWTDRMNELRLEGLARSFENCQDGIYPFRNKLAQENAPVTNHFTVNFNEGSHNNGIVGFNVQSAHTAVANSGATELADALKHVVEISTKALEDLADDNDKEIASSQLKTFAEEAIEKKPRKWLLDASGKGLIETLGKVAGTVAPVAAAIGAVLKLVNP